MENIQVCFFYEAFSCDEARGPARQHWILEDELHPELDLTRVYARAVDLPQVRGSQLRSRLTPDGMIGEVEDLDPQLGVRILQLKSFVRRCIDADDTWADERVAGDGPISKWSARRVPVDKRVGIEPARARPFIAGQTPVDAGGIGITNAASVLDVSRSARHGERKAVLQREDAADLPAAEDGIGEIVRVHPSLLLAERQLPQP